MLCSKVSDSAIQEQHGCLLDCQYMSDKFKLLPWSCSTTQRTMPSG